MKKQRKKHVVICCKKRGVFMGKVDPVAASKATGPLQIEECQMAVYFGDGLGVLGLATEGPTNCKITKPVTKFTLHTPRTAVMEITKAALKKWKACPWI